MKDVVTRCFKKTAVQVCTVILPSCIFMYSRIVLLFLHSGNLIRNTDWCLLSQVKNKPWHPWVYSWIWHHREQKQILYSINTLSRQSLGFMWHFSKKCCYNYLTGARVGIHRRGGCRMSKQSLSFLLGCFWNSVCFFKIPYIPYSTQNCRKFHGIPYYGIRWIPRLLVWRNSA